MEEKVTKKSIVKEGFKRARDRFVIDSLPLSFFALICIVSFIGAFFAPFTLILTGPFLIIPAFFAVSAINTIAPNKETHEGLGFFVMFKAYFAQPFRGGYRVIFGLIKFLIVYLVTTIILSAIMVTTVLNKDPEYIKLLETIKPIIDEQEILNAIENYVSTSETFAFVAFISGGISFFVAFYAFAHHFATNSIKYYHNFLVKLPLPTQDLNVVHKKVISEIRVKFNKDYFSATWFLGLLLLIGMFGGGIICYYFLPQLDLYQAQVVGLFGGFILLLFFIPYFINAMQIIYEKYCSKYMDTFIDLSIKSLNEIKKYQQISEEKEQQVLDFLESQKQKEEEKKEEDSTDKK